MRQGRRFILSCVATGALSRAELVGAVRVVSGSVFGHASEEQRCPRVVASVTGVVTALDQNTLTVEKRGKKPRTVVFTKHSEMKTTGDVGKNARVTVYYRDNGGRAVAHRVVVKPERSHAAAGGS